MEFGFCRKARKSVHHRRFAAGRRGLIQGAAQHASASLQLWRQGIPVQSPLFQLPIGPALHRRQFLGSSMGKPQVEVAGPAAVLHQQHQKPVSAPHQPHRFQLIAGRGRPGDQTHQPCEVRQSSRQLQQQIVEGRPAQAEARQLPFQQLHR